MRLVEDGKLSLDTPVWTILNQFTPYNGRWGDSRLSTIAIRHLLHHTAGWDRMISGDPLAGDTTVKIARATNSTFPPSRDTVIRYMLSQKLDFEPGLRFAYSNFGYMLLGRVIEKISGQSYENYVRNAVLQPMGLTQVQHGKPTLAGRLPGEVKYYDYPGAPLVSSYVSATREQEPAPYGVACFDLNDADGGWVGSVIDLAKFTAMLDGARPRRAVSAESWSAMLAETPRNTWVDSVGWYGFGLFVTPQLGGLTWDHGGSYPGTRSYFWRFANGICYVFLFNGDSQDQNSLIVDVGNSVFRTLDALTDWPEHDLFPNYYPPRIADSGVVNAASFQTGLLAAGSLITIVGSDLGGKSTEPTVLLRDNAGVDRPADILYSAPDQLNVLLPGESAPGNATVVFRRENWEDAAAGVVVANVSPGLFTVNPAGLAAASLVRVTPGREPAWESVFQVDQSGNIGPRSIVFNNESDQLWIVLYGTGLRGRSSPASVTIEIGGLALLPEYCGSQVQFPGLDQINVALPRSLIGSGNVPVRVIVEGLASNTVHLTFG
jgi:N-acyl-D-amino-acid deacylase